MDNVPKLLPCPFCGGAASMRADEIDGTDFFIGCDDLWCHGYELPYAGEAAAIAAWNRRDDLGAADRGVTVEALANLAQEMRFLLRQNPKMDGGLYRQRLTEADAALASREASVTEVGQ